MVFLLFAVPRVLLFVVLSRSNARLAGRVLLYGLSRF